MPQNFTHFHLHTTSSRLDGMIGISDLAHYCAETGMTSVAISDHGIMSGALEFYVEARKAGINPIVGQEIYLVDDHLERDGQRWHEGLYAMNWEGYQNLVHLSSVGFTEGLRRNYFACIDDEQIAVSSAGIMCLSGCISSKLARTIMAGVKEHDTLKKLADQAVEYKTNPLSMIEARKRAQRVASNAIASMGQKKNRLLAESQALHAQLDQIQGIIAADGLEQYRTELQANATVAFDTAWNAGLAIVEKRQSVFGDRYYLETQIVPLEDQQIYNVYVRMLSERYGIPCLVTADAHYLRKEDADLHRQMLRIRTDKKTPEAKEKKIVKIEFADESQADAVKASSGEIPELEKLYDDIMAEELACVGMIPKTATKKYAAERAKWVKNATLFYLQNAGGAETIEGDDVGEDGAVSVDAIDPGRPFSEWMPEFYVRTPQEMLDAGALPHEMDNTMLAAARINLQIPLNDDTHRIVHMPDFKVPVMVHPDTGATIEMDYDSYLATLCVEGLRYYLDDHPTFDPNAYYSRLAYELQVIKESGFSSYFLIVWDYINAVRASGGLTGPGRGSAAGSLATFLLGITKVIDPMLYPDLMFERFLTPGRPDLPDIDTDIDFDSATWVFGYCGQTYGSDRVAKMGTFNIIGVKQALKDVGRVLDVPFLDREKAARFFSDWRPDDDDVLVDDNKAQFSLTDVTAREPELQALRDTSELHQRWFEYAAKLVGKQRSVSQHASGVAIASDNLERLGVPLLASQKGKDSPVVIATQYGMDDCAKLGIAKFDQLKLSSLTTIAETERLIGSDFSIETIPLDDKETYRSLSQGDNLGIFQMAQPKLRGVMKAVKPEKLADIAAIITIIRPGLFAKDEETGLTMEELYKARRQGSVPVKYLFPFMESITKDSQGVLIYQEQILRVLWECGFDPLDADKLRKILSKKQMSKAREFETRFIAGAIAKQNLTKDQADQLWAMIVEFAAYGFNAAHAYAYGLIAYWTAYLKTHYPAQFMAALLTVQASKNSKAAAELVPKLLEDCSQMGRNLPVLAPNVNRSQKGFSIELKPSDTGVTEAIRFGLGGISGVASLADHIIAERVNGEYENFDDFDRRLRERTGKRPNKTALVALAYTGAFDDFFSHRSKAIWAIECAREDRKGKRQEIIDAGWIAMRQAELTQRQAELCGNYYFVRDNLEVLGTDAVSNFFEKYPKEEFRIGGRVVDCKLDRLTKKQKTYHRATVKTQWGNVSVDFYQKWNGPEDHLQNIKAKLFTGSVIIVHGEKRDESSMFGSRITLPKKEFQGMQKENLFELAREAQALLTA